VIDSSHNTEVLLDDPLWDILRLVR